MKQAWQKHRGTLLRLAGLVIAVFAAVRFVHHRGWIMPLEIEVYDRLVRARHLAAQAPGRPHAPILIVAFDEDTIAHPAIGDYPIPDGKLALLLERIVAGGPVVVGLDLYRDRPYPSDGSEKERLDRILRGDERIVCIWKFGSAGKQIVPPPILADNPVRFGFNDVPVDAGLDLAIRRMLLYLGDERETHMSFGLLVALHFLQHHEIGPAPSPRDPNWIRLGAADLPRFEPNTGSFVNADAAGYQILLDYLGPSGFESVRLEDVLTGEVAPERFRDRIVLIGSYAPTLGDAYETPLQPLHWGIDIWAHMIDQIIRQAVHGAGAIRTLDEHEEALWCFLWCLIGAAAALASSSPTRFGSVLAGTAVLLAAVVGVAFWNLLWLPAVEPAVALAGSALLGTALTAGLQHRHRKNLMRLFSQQVSREVAEALWEKRGDLVSNGRLMAQEQTVTILFTDIKGYSTLSEGMEPSVLLGWLNEYMEEMTATIIAHRGVVNKFLGDGIMAIFGIPVPSETPEERERDAANAIRCARDMGRGLAELNQRWAARGAPTATMRAGITTGRVMTGSLGSSERLEYVVIGDAVNTASRLEGLEKRRTEWEIPGSCCRTVVGEPTWRLVRDAFRFRALGEWELRGKEQRLAVYLLEEI